MRRLHPAYIVLLTVLALGAGERAWHTYRWAGDVNRRADAGLASFRFLAAPVLDPKTGQPLKNKAGRVVTNADVLGVLVQERVAPPSH